MTPIVLTINKANIVRDTIVLRNATFIKFNAFATGRS